MPGPDLRPPGRAGRRRELQALDVALYQAVAASPTPSLDRDLARLSRAADHSKLWVATAGLIAAAGGRRGRRAAVDGLASIALTSAVVNLALKRLGRRRRPDPARHGVPVARLVTMPRSTSFPSGHAASAFAFASGAGSALPVAAVPLQAAAALVAYSRVHTGVHYPVDVVVGALLGGALAPPVSAAVARFASCRCPAPVGDDPAGAGSARRRPAWRPSRPRRRRSRSSCLVPYALRVAFVAALTWTLAARNR
jgi:undecaprenyl-diphosphatase